MQAIRSRRPSSLSTAEAAAGYAKAEAEEGVLGKDEYFGARGESTVEQVVSPTADASDLLRSTSGLNFPADSWGFPAETEGSLVSPETHHMPPGESPFDSKKALAKAGKSPADADCSPADTKEISAHPTEVPAAVSGKRRAHVKYEGRTIEAAAQGRGSAQLRGARAPVEFVDASRAASPLHKKGFLGSGVRVAVFDTGEHIPW